MDQILYRVALLDSNSYVFGGAVRDRLLGRAIKDIDISLSRDASSICSQLAGETGGHRIVIDAERGHERLVLREPGESQAWIDFSSHGDDPSVGAAERDFSVNSLAVPVADWADGNIRDRVVDSQGGVRDLESGLIRETSPGNIADDPVRTLRAVRFATELGFDIAPDTETVVQLEAAHLTEVSPERVREEIYAIFACENAMRGVELMNRVGLLSVVFPELDDARGVEQPPNHHYWDVFNHLVQTVGKVDQILASDRKSVAPEFAELPWNDEMPRYFGEVVGDGQNRGTLLRIAGLLHDVAKPETKTIDEDGRTRFLGHGDRGAEIAAEILTRLRCSRKVIDHVSLMIREHLRPGQISPGREAPTRRALYRFHRDLGPVAIDTVYLSAGDYLAARGPRLEVADWQGFCRVLSDILNRAFEEPRDSKASLLLDGNDIQRCLNLQPGPRLGRLLELLREAEATGRIQTRQEAIDMLRSEVARPASRESRQ